MSKVYYIISYDILDMDMYQQYAPLAVPLINEYGGEVLVSDTEAVAIEGNAMQMHALVSFPTKEAALGCYNDPRYREVMKLRINATTNAKLVLVNEIQSD